MMKHRFEHTILSRVRSRFGRSAFLTGREGSRIPVFPRSFIYVRIIGPRSNIKSYDALIPGFTGHNGFNNFMMCLR